MSKEKNLLTVTLCLWQGVTLHNVFKCIQCQSVRSAAVIYQMGKLLTAFKQLAISLVSFACIRLKGPLCGEMKPQAIKACYNQIITIYLHTCIFQYTVNPRG